MIYQSRKEIREFSISLRNWYTYQEWPEQADEKMNEVKKDGLNVVKTDIDMEELKKWCEDSDKPVDGYTRSEPLCTRLRIKKTTITIEEHRPLPGSPY